MTTLYFPGWAIYGRDHFLSDIDFGSVDEISYAFFGVNADGSLKTLDPFEWGGKAFTQSESVNGQADYWRPDSARGNANQFEQLSKIHPDLKLTVAFGGWTQSADISTAMLDDSRGALVANILNMARDYPWISGIDMDWEFPGSGGAAGNTRRAEDGENYGKFLAELRDGLDGLSGETGKDYSISVAAPPGLIEVESFGFELGVGEHADVINFMAYDYHGGWESQTGLQSGIFDTYSGNEKLGVAATLKAMFDKGVDVSKVNLGIPLYARGWRIDDSTPIEEALGAPSIGLAVGSFERGVYDAKDILGQIQRDPSAWTVVYDTDAMGAYAVGLDGTFVSIETRSTVALKAAWAKANGFNGIMFWDSSGDPSGEENSLLKAGNDVWIGAKSAAEIMAQDPIQFDLLTGDGDLFDLLELDEVGQPYSIFDDVDAHVVEVSEIASNAHEHGHNHSDGFTLEIEPETDGLIVAFDAATDLVYFAPEIAAEDVQIFGESGAALGETVRIAVARQDGSAEVFILTGVTPAELSFNNFLFSGNADLAQSVGAFLGYDIDASTNEDRRTSPDDGGKAPEINGYTETGGRLFDATPGGADVRDFVIGTDKIDLGGQSVHGVIVGENQDGDLVVLSPWAAGDHQIFHGVKVANLSVDDFAIVGNEHFRQDLGAVLSFNEVEDLSETGRVLVTGHRYGHEQVIHGFDPQTHILDMRYLNTRERLSVTDTDEGLRISVEPTGDTTILAGVTRADLVGRNIQFHNDQVIEDNVEVPFGFTAKQVTLAGREGFVTPYAPAGESTDGFQVRLGTHTGEPRLNDTPQEDHEQDTAMEHQDVSESEDRGDETVPVVPVDAEPPIDIDRSDWAVSGSDAVALRLDWSWGRHEMIEGFNPDSSVVDIGWIGATSLTVSEIGRGVLFQIGGNNQSALLVDVSLSELSKSNFAIRDESAREMIEALIAEPGKPALEPEPVIVPEVQPPTVESPVDLVPAATGKEVLVDWNWGEDSVYEFNPETDTLYIGWINPEILSISEVNNGLRIAIESNNQTILLNDVSLAELSHENISTPDDGVREYFFDLL